MGVAPARPAKLHIDFDGSRERLAANDDNTTVICTRDKIDWRANTIVSSQPVRLRDKHDCLCLSFRGASVCRIGLSGVDPKSDADFMKRSVFEVEDGFAMGKKKRELFVDDSDNIHYRSKKKHREFPRIFDSRELYLYITVVYGCPSIDVQYGREQLAMDSISNIGTQDISCITFQHNIVKCKIREPLTLNTTYFLHWDMRNENKSEMIGDRTPLHGLMTLRLLKKHLSSLETDVLFEDGSAVKAYPYSGKIAFRVESRKRKFEHNLFIDSVDETRFCYLEEKLTDQLLEMEIELSAGQLRVEYANPVTRDVLQARGTLLHVTNYPTDKKRADIILDINSATKHRPGKLQFGLRPDAFVIEFQEFIDDNEFSKLRSKHFPSCERIEYGATVQVVGVPESASVDDIETYFSRPQYGGGEIDHIQQEQYMTGCWLVTFKKTKVATKLWTQKEHFLCGRLVTVYPYFATLGCATVSSSGEYGDLPVYDRNDLVLAEVDALKIRLLKEHVQIQKRIEEEVSKTVKVSICIKSVEFGNSSIDRLSIVCKVSNTDCKTMSVWRELAAKSVVRVLDDIVLLEEYTFQKEVWKQSIDFLESQSGNVPFVFTADKEKFHVTLVAFGQQNMNMIKTELYRLKPLPAQTTETVPLTVETFDALKHEGLISELEKSFRNISIKINQPPGKVAITGPQNEVREASKKLMQIALNAGTVIISISKGMELFLQTEEGTTYLQNCLKQRMVNPNFTVRSQKITIATAITSGSIWIKRNVDVEGVLKGCSVKLDIPPDRKQYLNTEAWTQLKQRHENDNVFIHDITENQCEIVGLPNKVTAARTSLQGYLEEELVMNKVIQIPSCIAEYLHKFRINDYPTNCTFVRHQSKQYTGEILLKAAGNAIVEAEKQILSDAKEVNIYYKLFSSPWLASVVHEIHGLGELVNNKKCIISADIGDTLAANNIECVLTHRDFGVVIEAKLGNIAYAVADCIVNPVSTSMRCDKGIAETIARKGGKEITEECQAYVDCNGKPEDGAIIEGKPGKLRCLKLFHVVGPRKRKGRSDEEMRMFQTVKSVLEHADENGFTSVAMPALRCDRDQFPEDTAASNIVGAMEDFFNNLEDNGTSIKKISLYADTQSLLEQFVVFLESISSDDYANYYGYDSDDDNEETGWKFFKHGRPLPNVETFPLSRKSSGQQRNQGLQRSKNKPEIPIMLSENPGIFWKNDQKVTVNLGMSTTKSSFKTSLRCKPKATVDCFKDGLPYKVPVTDRLVLIVEMGDITKMKTDAVVNTMYEGLRGAISDAILKAGGDELKKELAGITILGVGDIEVTGAGNIPCRNVFHTKIPRFWDKENGKDNVYKIVQACLKKAVECGTTSIAFPSIGTGASQFPAASVAEAMVKAVCDHARLDTSGVLVEVHIVLFAGDTHSCKTFEIEIPKVIEPFNNPEPDIAGDMKVTLYQPQVAHYVPPTTFEEHTDADDMVLFKIVSMKQSLKIWEKIEEAMHKECITKDFNSTTLGEIAVLSVEEQEALTALETKHGVGVLITNDDGTSVVQLSGLRGRVAKAEVDVLHILQYEIPKARSKEAIRHKLKETVQWFYDDNGTKQNFDSSSNYEIHMGFAQGRDFFYYNPVEGADYKVIIASQQEHPATDPTRIRQIYQRTVEPGKTPIPNDWHIATTDEEQAKVELHKTDSTFSFVSRKFEEDGCNASDIIKIYRLEQRYMWQMYQAKKKQMDLANPPGVQNERLLWHGTDDDTVGLIMNGGYDRSFCGKNATAYGEGAYFATESSYSAGYAHPDAMGVCRMFLNRVLTGIPTQGYYDLAYLPIRELKDGVPILYDSAADDEDCPGMYIIFHDSQAYPEFLIEYSN